MILSCPSCQTQFNVPDGAISAEGRKVRCASCHHVWHATPQDAVQPAPRPMPARAPATRAAPPRNPYEGAQAAEGARGTEMDPAVASRMEAIRREMMDQAAPQDGETADGSDEDEGAEPTQPPGLDGARPSDLDTVLGSIRAAAGEAGVDVDDDEEDQAEVYGPAQDADDALARLSARTRKEGAREQEDKRRRMMLGFWALLGLIWIGLPVMLFGFPDTVLAVWPKSQVIYDAISSGSDVERFRDGAESLSTPITEEPEVVEALLDPPRTEERAGQIALVLSGYVENRGRRSARVPRLRISVLDSRSQVVDYWDFDPPGRIITRGQKLVFEQERAPVPPGANQVIVTVLEGQYSNTEAELPE